MTGSSALPDQMYSAFGDNPCDTREANTGELRYLPPTFCSRLAHPIVERLGARLLNGLVSDVEQFV